MAWLAAWLAAGPLPGTTTPIQDLLRAAHLDGLITLGALVASVVQIIAVFRTLFAVTRGRAQQAEIMDMQRVAYARQAAILAYLGLDDEAGEGKHRYGGDMTDQPAEQYEAEPETEPEHPDITPDQYEDTERDPAEPDDTEPEEAGKNDGPTEGVAP